MTLSLHNPWFRRSVIGIAALLLLALGAALYLRINAKATSKPINLSNLYWIYYREDLVRLQQLDPAIIGQTVSGPGTYALEHDDSGPPLPSGVIPVELFFSYATEQSAISNKAILPGVKTVADDPEYWPATPVDEQRTPLAYMQDFTKAATAKGLSSILIPGRDLMSVPNATCGQQSGETVAQAYVRCGLPGAAANARVFVIQAASVETDQTALTQLAQTAAAAARAANPHVIIIASLSTDPEGNGAVSAGTLNSAARAMLPYVQGFELNTTAPTDSTAIAFLHDLAGS